jgi:hypothetical protein
MRFSPKEDGSIDIAELTLKNSLWRTARRSSQVADPTPEQVYCANDSRQSECTGKNDLPVRSLRALLGKIGAIDKLSFH